jgi:hypothetical protein
MKDIFISYASENRPLAQRLAAGLEQSGFSVWWDRNIAAGSEGDTSIEEALGGAKCVVVLWTGQAKHSRGVRAEAREALTHEKVVPVMLEDNAIPLAFTGMQALRFPGWNGASGTKEFDILRGVLRAKLAGKPVEFPESASTTASWTGTIVAFLLTKPGMGVGLALLLLLSAFWGITPEVRIHVETSRIEFSVKPDRGDIRLTDQLTFDTLTIQNVSKISLKPDHLLVADPADYDLTSNTYPPKAWVEVPLIGDAIQFEADKLAVFSEITIEPTDHDEAGPVYLDGLILTGEAVVAMGVSSDDALTWSIREKQGLQRVVVSGIHGVQLIQTGLKVPSSLSIPFPQNQELTYQAIFESQPGTLELFGQDQALVLVLQEKGLTAPRPISSSALAIDRVDFSQQDPGTGERNPPEGFSGRVEYVNPPGMSPVTIGAKEFLTLENLKQFEILSIMLDPVNQVLAVDLHGKPGSITAGAPQNPRDLRPTVYEYIRFSPLFEPVRKFMGF